MGNDKCTDLLSSSPFSMFLVFFWNMCYLLSKSMNKWIGTNNSEHCPAPLTLEMLLRLTNCRFIIIIIIICGR